MSRLSTQPNVEAVQLQLFCAQARAAWAYVEELEGERKRCETLLRDTRHERLWANNVLARARIDRAVAASEKKLAEMLAPLQKARDAALVSSERATAYGWGVKLGRRYRITREGLTVEMLVQNLRPLPAVPGSSRMLASGVANNRPTMFVLGRDVLVIEPVDAEKVIDISARLHARGAKVYG